MRACVTWAFMAIEAMTDRPSSCGLRAYTSRLTEYTAFRVAAEAGDYDGASKIAEQLVQWVREHRDRIPGPHLLCWRILPEVSRAENGRWSIYARLAFETDLARAQP